MNDATGTGKAFGGARGIPQRVHTAAECFAPAILAGLYLARVWCEARPSACRLSQIALAAVGGLALAVVALFLLRRLRLETWPLLLPGAYVLWPHADARLALAVGVASAVALALAQRRAWPLPGYLAEFAAGLGSLALYVSTLAPSVQPADAGEFQLVASILGIAHPPGYPLYTLLGKAFTLLPLGDPAWRVNLFAAVCAAATVAVVARSVRQATGSAAAGLLSALALGLTPTFWAQGTFANIRSLTALLAALAMHGLVRYGETRSPRHLLAFAVSYGLGVTHHASLWLLAPPFAAYLLAVDPRLFLQPRRWLAPVGGFAATFAVLLYLPLRSAMNPPFDSPSVRTLPGLVAHFLALGFQGDFLYFLGKPTLGLRVVGLADILSLEFGLALWLGALALGLYAARRRWSWLLLWGGVALVNSLAAATYRAPQTVEYLLPTYVALAMGLGLGLGILVPSPWQGERGGEGRMPLLPSVGGRLRAAVARRQAHHGLAIPPHPTLSPQGGEGVGCGVPLRTLLAGLAAWLALSNGLAAYPSFLALHRDGSVRASAVELLQSAPAGALILSNWHQATPLWYLQEVEGLRRDVTVAYVYPEGATPNGQVWARRIREAVDERPVMVTNRFPECAALPYRLAPLAGAWRVEASGSREPPPGLGAPAAVFGERIELLGMRLGESASAPGRAISVRVAWRPQQPLDRDYSWFVHLAGPQGIAGQADRTYRAGQVAVGEVVADDYRFSLRPDTPPGEYLVIVGVYITFPDGNWERLRTAEGQDAIPLARVVVRPRPGAPATAHSLAEDWADGSRLAGVDFDDSVAGQRRVYLHWRRPAGAADLELTLLGGGQPVGAARVGGGAEAGYLTVACDLPAGTGDLALLATAGGQALPRLGPWHRLDGRPLRLPDPPGGARYLDLGGEMVLVGAQWRPESPAPGAPFAATLKLIAQRPLLADYAISLSLEGEGWKAQHDGTPVLGAIPTLKWLSGWRVRDPRRIEVPQDAAGPARLRLTVYDAFTLEPLAVGDDRLAKAGQGVQATLWEGSLR